MLIHVFRDGEEMGPFTAAQVLGLMEEGRLSPEDLAWSEGLDEWTKLGALVPAQEVANVPEEHEKEPEPMAKSAKAAPLGIGKALLWAGVGLGATALAIISAVHLLKEKEQPATQEAKPGKLAKGINPPEVQPSKPEASNEPASSLPTPSPSVKVNPPLPPVSPKGASSPVPPLSRPTVPPAVLAELNVVPRQATLSPEKFNVFMLNHWPDADSRALMAAETATALAQAGKTGEAREIIRRAWVDVRKLPGSAFGEFGADSVKETLAGAALAAGQGGLAATMTASFKGETREQFEMRYQRPHDIVNLARQGKVTEARVGLREYLDEGLSVGVPMINELRNLSREGQVAVTQQLVAVMEERLMDDEALAKIQREDGVWPILVMASAVREMGGPTRVKPVVQKMEKLAQKYQSAGKMTEDEAAQFAALFHKTGHFEAFQRMVMHVNNRLGSEVQDEEKKYARMSALLQLARLQAAKKNPVTAEKLLDQALALSVSMPGDSPVEKWQAAVLLARMDQPTRSRQLAREALTQLEAQKQRVAVQLEALHARGDHNPAVARDKFGAQTTPGKLRALDLQSQPDVRRAMKDLTGTVADFAGWMSYDNYYLDSKFRANFTPAEKELAQSLVDLVNGKLKKDDDLPAPPAPPLPEWARRIPGHPSLVIAANFGQFLNILKQLPTPLRKRLQLEDSVLAILDGLMQGGAPKLAARPSVLWMKSVSPAAAQTMEWTVGLRIPVKGVEDELRKFAASQKLELPFKKEPAGPFKLLDLHNLLQLAGAGLKLGDAEIQEIRQSAAGYIGIADDQVVLLGLINWKRDPDNTNPVPAPLANGSARARDLFRKVFVQAPPAAVAPVRWARLSHSTTLAGFYLDWNWVPHWLSQFTPGSTDPDLSADAKKAYKELFASAALSAVIRLNPNTLNFEATIFHDKLTGEVQSTLPRELLAALPPNTVNAAALALDMSAVREFVMNDVVKFTMKVEGLEGKVDSGDLQAQLDEDAREYLGLPLTEFTSLVPRAVVLGLPRPGGALVELGQRPPEFVLGAQLPDAATVVRMRGQLEDQIGKEALQTFGLKLAQRGNLLFLGTGDLKPPANAPNSKAPPMAKLLKNRAAAIVIDGPTLGGVLRAVDVLNPEADDHVNRMVGAIDELNFGIQLGKGRQDYRAAVTLHYGMTWKELLLQVSRAITH